MDTEHLKIPMPEPPLRFLKEGDFRLWRAWFNNTEFFSVPGVAEKPPEARKNDESYIDLIFEEGGKVRAICGFTGINLEKKTTNIYVFVYTSLMNLGITGDVVESLCSYGLEKLELKKINIIIYSDDYAMIEACKKYGFREELGAEYKPGGHHRCRYTLNREDWTGNLEISLH